MKKPTKISQALGIAAALLMGAPLMAATDEVRTLHIEVQEHDDEDASFRMEMPVALLQAMARSIDIDELSSKHVIHELEHEGIDVRKLWREIRDADIREFFTLESDEANVKAWREDGLFKMTVTADDRWHRDSDSDDDGDGDRTEVEITVPEMLMDLLVEEEDMDPEAFLDALQAQGPMTLVRVESEDGDKVKVWLD